MTATHDLHAAMAGDSDLLDQHDLVENEEGELLLVIEARPGEPDGALLYVSAEEDVAVLQRHSQDRVRLADMLPDAASRLRAAEQVLVSEVDPQAAAGDEIRHVYEALTTVVRTVA